MKALKGRRRRSVRATQRAAHAWRLYCQGRTQDEIADELGISQPAVSKLLAREEARVRDEITGDISRFKAEQVARLTEIFSEAWSAYLRSLKPAVTAKLSNDGTQTVERKRRDGDSRHLNVALTALADIRKVLGLDAPTKTLTATVTRPDEGVSDEALKRELEAIYKAAGLEVAAHE